MVGWFWTPFSCSNGNVIDLWGFKNPLRCGQIFIDDLPSSHGKIFRENIVFIIWNGKTWPVDYIESPIYSFISFLSPRILPTQFTLNMPVETIMDRSTLALYIVA